MTDEIFFNTVPSRTVRDPLTDVEEPSSAARELGELVERTRVVLDRAEAIIASQDCEISSLKAALRDIAADATVQAAALHRRYIDDVRDALLLIAKQARELAS